VVCEQILSRLWMSPLKRINHGYNIEVNEKPTLTPQSKGERSRSHLSLVSSRIFQVLIPRILHPPFASVLTAVGEMSVLGMPFAISLPGWAIKKKSAVRKLPR
jgi:hypothetical protein